MSLSYDRQPPVALTKWDLWKPLFAGLLIGFIAGMLTAAALT